MVKVEIMGQARKMAATATVGKTQRRMRRPPTRSASAPPKLEVRHHLGHAEGAGQDAVAARDAAGFPSGLDHAARVPLDGVAGADLGAGG
jgi:hypothetical protein